MIQLEIHHIGITAGDATAIVIKEIDDTNKGNIKMICKVLIDAGGEGSDESILSNYCRLYLGETKFNYIIASHYHADHIKGFSEQNIQFCKFIDIGGHFTKEKKHQKDLVNEIMNLTNIDNKLPEAGSNYFESYCNHIDGCGGLREKIEFIDGGKFNEDGTKKDDMEFAPLKLKLCNEKGVLITLTCCAANGVLANGTNIIKKIKKEKWVKQKGEKKRNMQTVYEVVFKNINDYSLAFLIEWDDFRYFTAGDLSGDLISKEEKEPSYYNIEEPLVDYLTNPVDGILKDKSVTVLKADHHGSSHNNYDYYDEIKPNNSFLKRLKPSTILVPCNQYKGLPSGTFLKKLRNYANGLTKEEKDNLNVCFINTCEYPYIEPKLEEGQTVEQYFNDPEIEKTLNDLRKVMIPVTEQKNEMDKQMNLLLCKQQPFNHNIKIREIELQNTSEMPFVKKQKKERVITNDSPTSIIIVKNTDNNETKIDNSILCIKKSNHSIYFIKNAAIQPAKADYHFPYFKESFALDITGYVNVLEHMNIKIFGDVKFSDKFWQYFNNVYRLERVNLYCPIAQEYYSQKDTDEKWLAEALYCIGVKIWKDMGEKKDIKIVLKLQSPLNEYLKIFVDSELTHKLEQLF